MTDTAGAEATADDATVVVGHDPVEREDRLAEAKRVVEATKAKVERQREHLASVQTVLATAEAELARVRGEI